MKFVPSSRAFLSVFCLSLMGLGIAPVTRAVAQEPVGKTTKVPVLDTAQTQKGGSHRDMIILTVDKDKLHAELKTWPEDAQGSTLLKRFRIGIGKAEGDKEFEGDNRTPEGIYFVQNQIMAESLPVKYGRRAIPIDYPNPIDRAAGKTGHGIWLHGVERDERVNEEKVTEGCVVFYNADITSLASWLRGYQGVVVIAKDVAAINRPEDLAAVKARTRDWMQAWAERRPEDYVGFYGNDFRFGKQNLRAYSEYKKRVFHSYRNMEVSFDNLRVVTHPKYAVTFFNQDFHGDRRFTSIGRKALYWVKDASGKWLIKREVFENRRFEFMTFTDAELALLSAPVSGISSDKEKKAPNL